MNKTIVAAALLLVTRMLSAQTTASLTGTVTVSGEPAAGVTVTISSPALQGTRTALTGDGGSYSFPALPPGEYSALFAREGLLTTSSRVTLRLSQAVRLAMTTRIAAIRLERDEVGGKRTH